MKKIHLTFVALAVAFASVAGDAPSALAGSNNGTNNWYWKTSCSAGGQTAIASNYDTGGGSWQEYHTGMTTSGSIFGYKPTALYINGNKRTSYLRDRFDTFTDQNKKTLKFVWSKPTGSVSCSIYG